MTEPFHCYATHFVLIFLLRRFFKTFEELLHLLTLHLKFPSWGELKKGLMVSEDRSYQTRDFSKIFPSS